MLTSVEVACDNYFFFYTFMFEKTDLQEDLEKYKLDTGFITALFILRGY